MYSAWLSEVSLRIQGSYDKSKVYKEYNLVVPTILFEQLPHIVDHLEITQMELLMKHVRTWRNCLM